MPLNVGTIKQALKRSRSPWSFFILFPYRFWFASKHFFKPWLRVVPWLFKSRETINWTYDLSDLCRESLAMFVAEIACTAPEIIRGYLQELAADEQLEEHVLRYTFSGPLAGVSDPQVRPGKRTIYYALVRAMKPQVIVEAGVDKGLGSCILASALLRNRDEGFPGCLYACDISPQAGFLFREPFTHVGKFCIGDAVETIRSIEEPIDFFIQDIAPGLEAILLEALRPRLSKHSVVLSVWHTGVLMRFAEETGSRFMVFAEETKDHWYPGAKISVAFHHKPVPWTTGTELRAVNADLQERSDQGKEAEG